MVNRSFDAIPGISVDSFDMKSRQSSVFFLTHCHTDHFPGPSGKRGGKAFLEYIIEACKYIYSSELTKLILTNDYGADHTQNIRVIQPQNPIDVVVKSDVGETMINVTAIPAGHCPGSIMFLFCCQNDFNVVHTGDFRISPSDLDKFIQFKDSNGIKLNIDCLYLDTTFYKPQFEHFPKRSKSIDAICKVISTWIEKGNDYIVEIMRPAYYGSEHIFVDVSRRLQRQICIPEKFLKTYRSIPELDNIFTADITDCQIFINMAKYGEATKYGEDKHVCVIKPTAMYWENWEEGKEFCIKENSQPTYRICYSSHCSRFELTKFVQFIRPKRIVPFVINGNDEEDKAMERQLNEICNNLHKDKILQRSGEVKRLNSPRKMKKCHERFLNRFKTTKKQIIPPQSLFKL